MKKIILLVFTLFLISFIGNTSAACSQPSGSHPKLGAIKSCEGHDNGWQCKLKNGDDWWQCEEIYHGETKDVITPAHWCKVSGSCGNGGGDGGGDGGGESIAIDGECSSNHYSCKVGNVSNESSYNGKWTWKCSGSNGGSDDYCSEGQPVNGECSSRHFNCNSGYAYNTNTALDEYTWKCRGTNGGYDSGTCRESRTVDAECGSDEYSCENKCTFLAEGGTREEWAWICEGRNGGSDVKCNKTKKFCGDGIKGKYGRAGYNDNGVYEECDNGGSNGSNNYCTSSCKIERIKPNGSINYNNGWTNENIILNISAYDGQSGVKSILLKENGSYKKYVSGNTATDFNSNDNGKSFKYSILVKDNAGNTFSASSPNTIKYDGKKPNVDILVPVSGNVYFDGTTKWTKDDSIKVSIKGNDEHSGINNITLKKNSNNFKSFSSNINTELNVSLRDGENFDLKLFAEDNAGNKNEKGLGDRVGCDKSITSGSIFYDGEYKQGGNIYWTADESRTVNIKALDDKSGLQKVELLKNNAYFRNYNYNTKSEQTINNTESKLTYAQATQFQAKITDNVGNSEIFKSNNILKLDDKNPSGTINFKNQGDWIVEVGGKKWVRTDRQIEYTTTDYIYGKNGSGIKDSGTYISGDSISHLGSIYSTNFSNFDNGKSFQYSLWVEDNVGHKLPGTIQTEKVYFDNQAPVLSTGSIENIKGADGWTNGTYVDVNFTLTDVYNSNNGSGIKSFELVEYIDGTKNTSVNYNCFGDEQTKTCSYKKNFNSLTDNGKVFTYKIVGLKDNVGNEADDLDVGFVAFDDIDPDPSDCTATNSGSFLTATGAQDFKVEVGTNGGSPIVLVTGDFETYDVKDGSQGIATYSDSDNNSSTKNILETTENISKVDGVGDKQDGNYRIYTQKIKKVCDMASNCVYDLTDFDYYVYADKIDKTNSSYDELNLDNGSAIASGKNYPLEVILKDTFGNAISPVIKSLSPYIRVRDVKINFKYTNKLHLDQYHNTNNHILNSGICIQGEMGLDSLDIGNNKEKGIDYSYDINNTYKDGKYIINFSVHSPTTGSNDGREYIDPSEKFEITDIVGITKDSSLGTKEQSLFNSEDNIDFAFKPIYHVTFSGSIEKSGLIEGAAQYSQINVEQNGSGYSTGNTEKIFLEFGSSSASLLKKLDLSFEEGTGIYGLGSEIKVSTGSLDFDNSDSNVNLRLSGIDIMTLLLQKLGTKIDRKQDTRLSTYIKYQLGGKTVIYPQAFIGGALKQKTKQTGLNVIGYISNSITSIINKSKGRDLNNIGDFTKLDFKKAIEKNIFKALKSEKTSNGNYKIVDLSDWENSQTDGRKLNNNSILYFKGGDSNNLVTLDKNLVDEIEIKGKKTIVIIGADLYIKDNMYYQDKNKDILGVIVMKDETGKGGNVYIDPSVTNMVGTYYLSKTLQSGELDSTTNEMKTFTNVNNIDKLKNQLHIFGNIFSENTIGGSRGTDLKCPYYISDCSSREIAQKYDLNFLRRFVLVYKETNNSLKELYLPMNNGKVIGNGICRLVDNDGDGINDDVECNGNSRYARTVKNTDDPYASQSVIIEYNSNFLDNMPPLFKK